MELPGGTVLHCKIYYKILYVSGGRIENCSKEYRASCLLAGFDSITGHAIAVSRIQSAREAIWDDWLDFKKKQEERRDVSRLMITNTEYWTDFTDDRARVTKFIDRYVRSIPGYSQVPWKF